MSLSTFTVRPVRAVRAVAVAPRAESKPLAKVGGNWGGAFVRGVARFASRAARPRAPALATLARGLLGVSGRETRAKIGGGAASHARVGGSNASSSLFSPSSLQKLASAAAAATLSLSFALGAATAPAVASVHSSLGKLEQEIEAVEPAVADAVPTLTATLGAAEVGEIEAELRAIEAAADALDAKSADAVGADTPALDAATRPLLARLEAVKELVGLAGARE